MNPSESMFVTFLTVTKHLMESNKGREIYFGSRLKGFISWWGKKA